MMKARIITKTCILVVVLNSVVFYSLSIAASPVLQSGEAVPAIKAKKTPSVAPMKKVLLQPIVLNEASIPTMSLRDRMLAAINRVQKAYSPVRFTDCPSGWFSLEEIYYGGYKTYVNSCANRSYSVQDQMAAGCQGSDTVDQCTEKLFRNCLRRYEQDKTSYNDSSHAGLKSRISKGIEKADKIHAETKELSDALTALKNLMP